MIGKLVDMFEMAGNELAGDYTVNDISGMINQLKSMT